MKILGIKLKLFGNKRENIRGILCGMITIVLVGLIMSISKLNGWIYILVSLPLSIILYILIWKKSYEVVKDDRNRKD